MNIDWLSDCIWTHAQYNRTQKHIFFILCGFVIGAFTDELKELRPLDEQQIRLSIL